MSWLLSHSTKLVRPHIECAYQVRLGVITLWQSVLVRASPSHSSVFFFVWIVSDGVAVPRAVAILGEGFGKLGIISVASILQLWVCLVSSSSVARSAGVRQDLPSFKNTGGRIPHRGGLALAASRPTRDLSHHLTWGCSFYPAAKSSTESSLLQEHLRRGAPLRPVGYARSELGLWVPTP